MVFLRGSVVAMAALSYAMAFLSSNVLASSSSISSSGCIDTFIADGDCDLINNNAQCGR